VIADVATVFDTTRVQQGEGHHSRIGIVTYGTKAEAKYKLDAFKSNEEFLDKVWEVQNAKDNSSDLRAALMLTQEILKEGRPKNVRENVKQAIIIYTSVYKEGHYEDARQLAEQIKISGTDIIVVAFDQYGKPNALEEIRKIATPGFYFSNVRPNLAGEIRHALCIINCFCKKQWLQYAPDTVKYGVCLRMGGIDANWVSAKRACINMGHGKGYLATVLDRSKHDFVAHMFKNDYRMDAPYMYHIGLSYDSATENYYWEQPTGTDKIPLGWQNEHCRSVSKRYICQVDSCDTDNYCEREMLGRGYASPMLMD
ncbi:unnamed protein product, partial [Strongylus vulgaris]